MSAVAGSVTVGCRHSVTTRSVSFIAVSMMRVCTLQHQTGAQYSVIEYPDLANHLIRAMCEFSFPHSDS